MAEAFFEDPLYVYFALGFAELVLGVIWYEKRTRRWAMSLMIPVVLAVAVGGVEHLVVTDRERIIAAAKDIAEAAETRQLERIPKYLDESFSGMLGGAHVGREEVVSVCNSSISQWAVRRVNFGRIEVEITGDEAKMRVVTVIIHGENRDFRIPLIWEVTWIKRRGIWRILRVKEPRRGIWF